MRQFYSSFVLNGQASPKRSPRNFPCFKLDFANDDELLQGNQEDRKYGSLEPSEDLQETSLKVCWGEPWGAHFHSWRGNSEKRYMCSVFPLNTQQPLGGLPEFSQAIALAVAYDLSGRRICLSLFPFSWINGVYEGSTRPVEAAIGSGAQEWHIHLLAPTLSERCAVLDDLRTIPKHGDDFSTLLERREISRPAFRY